MDFDLLVRESGFLQQNIEIWYFSKVAFSVPFESVHFSIMFHLPSTQMRAQQAGIQCCISIVYILDRSLMD